MEEMGKRKRGGQPEGADRVLKALGYAPRTVQHALSHLVASPRAFNLTVSNIPGPPAPLYMLGCELEEVYPVVPIPDRHALSIGMTTLADQAFFGVYADCDSLPDADLLAELLDESVDELLELAGEPVPYPPRLAAVSYGGDPRGGDSRRGAHARRAPRRAAQLGAPGRPRRPPAASAHRARRRARVGGRGRVLRLRQPGGRGQPRRRADVADPGRLPARGGRRHGQPALRLGARGGRPGRARRDARRGRRVRGRRRGVDEPRAARDAEGGEGVPVGQPHGLRLDARLAHDQSRDGAGAATPTRSG